MRKIKELTEAKVQPASSPRRQENEDWASEFSRLLFNGLIGIPKMILQYLLLIRKNKWTILVLLFLGLAGGYAYYYFDDNAFESSLLIESSQVESTALILKIDQLHALCQNKKHQQLASIMGISLEESKGIEAIQYESCDSAFPTNSVAFQLLLEEMKPNEKLGWQEKMKNLNSNKYHSITLKAKDQNSLYRFGNQLIMLLKQDSAILPAHFKHLQVLQDQQSKLNKEIVALDTLKNTFSKEVFKSRTYQSNQPFMVSESSKAAEISSLYDIYFELNQKTTDLSNEIESHKKDALVLKNSILTSAINQHIGFKESIFSGLLVGLLLSFIWVLMIYLNKQLDKLDRKAKAVPRKILQ